MSDIVVYNDGELELSISVNDKEVYYKGASLKELGNKVYPFTKMDIFSIKIQDLL